MDEISVLVRGAAGSCLVSSTVGGHRERTPPVTQEASSHRTPHRWCPGPGLDLQDREKEVSFVCQALRPRSFVLAPGLRQEPPVRWGSLGSQHGGLAALQLQGGWARCPHVTTWGPNVATKAAGPRIRPVPFRGGQSPGQQVPCSRRQASRVSTEPRKAHATPRRIARLALTLSFPRVSTGPPASDFPSTSLAFLQGRGRLSSVTVHGPPLPEFPSDAAQVGRVGQGRHGSDVTSSPLSYTWRAQCASSC